MVDSNHNQQKESDHSDKTGTLIKIVYFSTNSKCSTTDEAPALSKERQEVPNGDLNHNIFSGRLYFVNFETSKIEYCIKFLSSKKLQQCGAQFHHSHAVDKIKIKATGGGAFKFANLFKEKLGITLDKVEEMGLLLLEQIFCLRLSIMKLIHILEVKRSMCRLIRMIYILTSLSTLGLGLA